MDIKSLTTNLQGKTQLEPNVVRPSVASSDQAPHTNTPLPAQILKAIEVMLQDLQLGKVFDVIVTRVEGSTVTLQIPGASTEAPVLQTEMKSPPPIGTRLTLQLDDQTPQPELKVIASPNSPQDAVSRNLRTGLQLQKAMTPLLANLSLLSNTTGKTAVDLPEVVIDTARRVLEQLPNAVQIKDPQVIKQAMQQSGPYLESLLAKQIMPVKTRAVTQQAIPLLDSRAGQPAKAGSELTPQLRLELVSQTIQTITLAMQQQPVNDVRANLLRLAALIRAVSEQQVLQKETAAAGDEPIAIRPQPRPLAPPVPAALADSKPPQPDGAKSPLMTKAINEPAAQTAATSHQNMIRSQSPQPQATVQASLAGILDQKSALDELLGQVDGALARIHVQQLQTAATDQQQRPVWVMELPVRTEQGVDLFDMRIQRDTEDHAPGDPKAPWSVNLAFDLEKLGAIRAKITLYGEDRISTVFWAEQHETSTYFNQHLDKLESRLKQVGLDVARIDCRCGKPDSPPPSNEPRLVDEKV